MWHCIILQKFNNISDEPAASHDQDKQQQATESSAISIHFYQITWDHILEKRKSSSELQFFLQEKLF